MAALPPRQLFRHLRGAHVDDDDTLLLASSLVRPSPPPPPPCAHQPLICRACRATVLRKDALAHVHGTVNGGGGCMAATACPHRPFGCAFEGTLAQVQTHLEAGGGGGEGGGGGRCGFVAVRREFAEHLGEAEALSAAAAAAMARLTGGALGGTGGSRSGRPFDSVHTAAATAAPHLAGGGDELAETTSDVPLDYAWETGAAEVTHFELPPGLEASVLRSAAVQTVLTVQRDGGGGSDITAVQQDRGGGSKASEKGAAGKGSRASLRARKILEAATQPPPSGEPSPPGGGRATPKASAATAAAGGGSYGRPSSGGPSALSLSPHAAAQPLISSLISLGPPLTDDSELSCQV